MRPKVTAAIPAYNSGKYIGAAIRSVLGQTSSCDEIVVVDDGSTDDTGEVAASFPGVRYIRQDNGGDANARNRAIAEAKGDFIAFLDADDLWLPKKIELQMRLFDADPSLGMVYSGVRVVDADLATMETLVPATPDIALRNTLLIEKPYMTGVGSSAIVPLSIARTIGFDERLGASSDWAFACRLALRHPVAAVSEPLALYRQHADSQVHRNLQAVESDMRLVLGEMFSDTRLDEDLRRYRRRAHANLSISLAASYFKRKERLTGTRYLASGFARRPDRVLAAFWRRYVGPRPSG